MYLQSRWNSAILKMFQIEYIGSDPYVSCTPSLHHHKLDPNDRFLVLSSDGLYQYFSNQEVVSHVEWFLEKFPEGDPAQYLIEELLFRAAKKAGKKISSFPIFCLEEGHPKAFSLINGHTNWVCLMKGALLIYGTRYCCWCYWQF